MREEDALRAMSQMKLRVGLQQDPITPPRPNPSLGFVAPAAARARHLVMRAIALFESNREVAWRCLSDASTLLAGESEAIGVAPSALQSVLRPGGLAAWQAKRTVEYIEDNLGSKMALRDMADFVALSPSYFSRAFKQSLGSSPMAYVARRRVERAKLMMTSTRERLAAIALACGFADQSHFTRSFSRFVGMSPRLWRHTSIGPYGFRITQSQKGGLVGTHAKRGDAEASVRSGVVSSCAAG
jgi:AraC family transcriptional regulator